MIGTGILKGMGITLKRFFSKKITQDYPDVMPVITPRSHGSLDFDAEKCITCGICANECPNSCIKLDTFKNEQGKKVLEKYSINLGYCLFCGLCVNACPKGALSFKTDFELACFSREGAIYTWKGKEPRPEETPAQPGDAKTAAGE
ncbi:MAG: NADH-quinone oxidoreductase subunit I [Clostridiales bacterium]|jgi:NADH-quinone oxidoreductase subunit I|nr:NADH-quinone oxidoreductase subunit I [Eubacteriales bacterium]MDH7566360.1 NADH-quinone oxidoreductase subunit I [Clostridiales bacterium]